MWIDFESHFLMSCIFCFATVYLPVSKSGCATKDQLMSQRTLQGVSQFSHSVVSDSLRPHESQHARPPCPLSATQTHVHRVGDAIQPSHPVVPFSSCPQSFPPSGSSQMSQIFASGAQSIGSFSFSISPSSEYSGLISFRIN